MQNLKTLHAVNKNFSIEALELLLFNQLPGNYKIIWHTKKDKWEINLRWNGQQYFDLYHENY